MKEDERLKYLDMEYVMNKASVGVLFVWYAVMIGLVMVGVHFLFPFGSVIKDPNALTSAQLALVRALIAFPDNLPVWIITVPVMVGLTLLVRRPWFPGERG